jgi:hypothetical protein
MIFKKKIGFFRFLNYFLKFLNFQRLLVAHIAICATHKQIMRGAYGKCATNKLLLVAWHWWRIPYAPRIRKKMRHL